MVTEIVNVIEQEIEIVSSVKGREDLDPGRGMKNVGMMIEDLRLEETREGMIEVALVRREVVQVVGETLVKKAIMISLARREGAQRQKELSRSQSARDLGLLGMLDHLGLSRLLLCRRK